MRAPRSLSTSRLIRPSRSIVRTTQPLRPEQEGIVAELDAEAVRGLLPAFEAKIQRVLARAWGPAS